MILLTALFNLGLFLFLVWAIKKTWYKATHCKWASDKARPGNMPPQDKRYKGGFTNLVECKLCDLKCLLEDRGGDPCPNCGGLKRRHFIGHWISDNARGGMWYERK